MEAYLNRSFLLASTQIPVSGIDVSSSSRLHTNNISEFPLYLKIRENLGIIITFQSQGNVREFEKKNAPNHRKVNEFDEHKS